MIRYYFPLEGKAILLIGALLSLTACSDGNKTSETAEKFPVIHPIVTDTLYYSDYVADIHSIQNVEIRARINGYLDRIWVDEGQSVKKNQLLFSVSSQEYREELAKAKAVLKSALADQKAAEIDMLNVKNLVEKGVVSKTEFDVAQSKAEALSAKIEEAKAHEASANLKLSYTVIRAPFNGIIDRIPYKVGSLIEESHLLTTLSDDKEVFAYFNVSEQEYLDFIQSDQQANGDEVQLILANNKVHSHNGVVETVEGKIDKSTGNIAFRARFQNPKGLIKHGSSGKVRLHKEVKEALIIPQKSTFEVQDKIYVYTVDADNTVRMHSIVPKFRLSQVYIIEFGLSTDDQIVYEGIQRVKDGDKIQPELVSLKTSLAKLGQ
jgi:RND family efflux transporter MFP subunit